MVESFTGGEFYWWTLVIVFWTLLDQYCWWTLLDLQYWWTLLWWTLLCQRVLLVDSGECWWTLVNVGGHCWTNIVGGHCLWTVGLLVDTADVGWWTLVVESAQLLSPVTGG